MEYSQDALNVARVLREESKQTGAPPEVSYHLLHSLISDIELLVEANAYLHKELAHVKAENAALMREGDNSINDVNQ